MTTPMQTEKPKTPAMGKTARRVASLVLCLACTTVGAPSHAEPTRAPPATLPQLRPVTPPTPTVPPGFHILPRLPSKGIVDVKLTGFGSSTAKGAIEIRGAGACRFRADIYDMNKPSPASTPVYRKMFDPATLPMTIGDIGPLPNGSYRAYLIGYDQTTCPVQGPDKKAGGWYLDFKVGNGAPSPGPAPSSSTPPTNGGGGATPPPGAEGFRAVRNRLRATSRE